MRAAAALIAALSGSLAAGPLQAEEVTVFAAASLATALTRIAEGWEAETGHDVLLSLAGSSALARQIEAGAPADLFLSASTDWMDRLEAAGLLVPGSRIDLLGNRLVLVAHGPEAAPMAPADLPGRLGEGLGEGRLAMALVDSVPAGIYGRQALEHLGLWEAIGPRVAQTDNVRAALALVAAGEAPFGIVYATDAAAEPGVSVVASFPGDAHDPIIYPAARIAGGEGAASAAFLAHLDGPDASRIFAEHGFVLVD